MGSLGTWEYFAPIIPACIPGRAVPPLSRSEDTKVYPRSGVCPLYGVGGQKRSQAGLVVWGKPDGVCDLGNVLSFVSAKQWLQAQALQSSQTPAEDPDT